MTNKECKRDSRLQSRITFRYTIKEEMRGVIYILSLVTFSTLLLLIGYFYEYHIKENPDLAKFRLRIIIYSYYWIIGLIIFTLIVLIIHYIIRYFKIKSGTYLDTYLDFADCELNRMLDKGKVTVSELNRFFLHDAMITMGIDPFSKPYIVPDKEEKGRNKRVGKNEKPSRYNNRKYPNNCDPYEEYGDYGDSEDYAEYGYDEEYEDDIEYGYDEDRPLSKKELRRIEKEERKLSKSKNKYSRKTKNVSREDDTKTSTRRRRKEDDTKTPTRRKENNNINLTNKSRRKENNNNNLTNRMREGGNRNRTANNTRVNNSRERMHREDSQYPNNSRRQSPIKRSQGKTKPRNYR